MLRVQADGAAIQRTSKKLCQQDWQSSHIFFFPSYRNHSKVEFGRDKKNELNVSTFSLGKERGFENMQSDLVYWRLPGQYWNYIRIYHYQKVLIYSFYY